MKYINNFLDHTSSNHKYFSISDKLLLCIVLSSLFLSQQLLADFTIESGITETAEQTLTTGQTGVIKEGGVLNVSGDAISPTGARVTITNSGSIVAGDDGIDSDGDSVSITNSGSITAEDDGIYSAGDNGTIANSGTITADDGMTSDGENFTITNSGTITAEDYGIYSDGDNGTITNSGNVTSEKVAIALLGDNATITNSGSVTAEHGGIAFNGDNATITNTGNITGEFYGIYSGGNSFTINNSGSIIGGTAAVAKVDTKGITLNLLPGSQILGAIRLGGGVNDTVNIYGGSVSATLTFVGTENINLLGLGVKSDNVVVSVDGTAEAARSVTLSNITGAIHGQITQRTAQRAPLETAKDTSSTISPSLYFKQRKPTAWAQPFGGSFDRDAEGGAGALAYDHDFVGGNLGYEWDLEKARVGLFGGMVHSQTDSKIKSFSTDTEHFYIGGYGSRQLQSFFITTSLLAGYGTHDTERLVFDNLNGKQKAKSDFDSVFISPSLTIATAYKIYSHFELRPSVNLTYSIAWLDGYSESGTTLSNLKVDDREIQAFSSKLQGAAAYILNAYSEIELRVGVNSRNTFDGDTKFSALGGQSKFANIGDENVIGGFVGARLKVANSENISLIADVQLGGNSNEDYLMGNLSLEYSFH